MSYVYEHPKLKNRNQQVAIRDRVAYLAGKQGHVMRHNYDVTLTTYTGVCRLCGAVAQNLSHADFAALASVTQALKQIRVRENGTPSQSSNAPDGIHHVNRIGDDQNAGANIDFGQSFDDRQQLHSVVGRGPDATGNFLTLAIGQNHGSPTARAAWVFEARAVRVNRHRINRNRVFVHRLGSDSTLTGFWEFSSFAFCLSESYLLKGKRLATAPLPTIRSGTVLRTPPIRGVRVVSVYHVAPALLLAGCRSSCEPDRRDSLGFRPMTVVAALRSLRHPSALLIFEFGTPSAVRHLALADPVYPANSARSQSAFRDMMIGEANRKPTNGRRCPFWKLGLKFSLITPPFYAVSVIWSRAKKVTPGVISEDFRGQILGNPSGLRARTLTPIAAGRQALINKSTNS